MNRLTTTARRVLAPAAAPSRVAAAAVIVAVAAAMAVAVPPGKASATTTATGTATVTTTSGSWATVLVDTNGNDSLGQPVTISWTLYTSPVYLSARNNGTLPLTGQTYTLTREGGLGNFTATACIGATWTTSGSCPTGNTRVLDTTASGSTSVSLALNPGASVSIKVSASVAAITTVTLAVTVTRSQTRAPTTTST